jgi:Zn-dependent peptidase ImmA (M78 family)/transcriptional regulator with XRE-family HTH domain
MTEELGISRRWGVPVSPAVLRWARETEGLTLADVAHRVGRPLEEVEAWELGTAQPTLSQLRHLAAYVHRPLAALLLTEPPAQPPHPVDFRTRASTRGRASLSRATRLAMRRARALQSVATELHDRPPAELSRFGVLDDTLDVASSQRALVPAGIPDIRSEWTALSSWRDWLEQRGPLVLQMSLPEEELRGFSFSGGGPPVIVASTADGPRARIFTLFHEYAHLLLGTGGICVPNARRASVRVHGDAERFCNTFAGAFLVPKDELMADPITDRLHAVEAPPPDSVLAPLTARFQVSRPVVWQQLYTHHVVSRAVYQQKWAQWEVQSRKQKKPKRAAGPVPTPRRVVAEKGRGFVGLVLDAEDRGAITRRDALDYLGIRQKDHDGVALAAGRA